MKLSQNFSKTNKNVQTDNDSINARILTQGAYIHKTMAGAYSFLPLGLKVIKNISHIVRTTMDQINGQEILMSALSPKENWEKTKRWDNKIFDALFHLPAHNKEYALNPTHEEIVTPLVKQFIQSHKDLPLKVYQIQTKFRNEPRAKSGLLRGREFLMKDLYSFHATQTDLDQYYETVTAAYHNIFTKLGVNSDTYYTYASGGAFSQYSHEFQILLPSGEDTIHICQNCHKNGKNIAINDEIKTTTPNCPQCNKNDFTTATACEIGNIFKLGTKFSTAFKLKFTDTDSQEKPVLMCCYGIGISRLMGVIAEYNFNAETGLNWPPAIAPAQIEIISLAKTTTDSSHIAAQTLYNQLQKLNRNVIWDDRLGLNFGTKMIDAQLIGSPTQIIITPRTLAQAEVELRQKDNHTNIKIDQVLNLI